MSTDQELKKIARELKLIRLALERTSPPPPKEVVPETGIGSATVL